MIDSVSHELCGLLELVEGGVPSGIILLPAFNPKMPSHARKRVKPWERGCSREDREAMASATVPAMNKANFHITLSSYLAIPSFHFSIAKARVCRSTRTRKPLPLH